MSTAGYHNNSRPDLLPYKYGKSFITLKFYMESFTCCLSQERGEYKTGSMWDFHVLSFHLLNSLEFQLREHVVH